MINVLGFAGSLRKGSYNRMLLKTCLELLPPETALEIFDLDGIPPFNQDLEKTPPPRVAEFKEKLKAADAILIVTPEANYSVPGMLKNAMDWASRPYGDNSFAGKNVAVMSASTGMLGGARAQYHLRQSFVFLDMYSVNKPEVFITFAPQKFDESGRLTDETARELMRTLLKTLAEQTRKALGKS
jgi:chromate reductase, NAD(P)H dehydrogenase (quinone)